MYGKVIAGKLHVRESYSVNSNSLEILNKDDIVLIGDVSTNSEWLPVYTNKGTEGWCMAKFIELIPDESEEVVEDE